MAHWPWRSDAARRTRARRDRGYDFGTPRPSSTAARRRGRSATSKWAAATAWLCSSSDGPATRGRHPGSRGRRRRTSGSRRPQLPADRVGPDGERPPVRCGLDRRVAEALPRRREHDRVAGGIGVGDATGVPRRMPASHRTAGRPQQPFELGSVAVLGRAEQPVGGAEGRRERESSGDVLARQWRGSAGGGAGSSRRRRGRRACRRGRPAGDGIEDVVHGRRPDAVLARAPVGELVDARRGATPGRRAAADVGELRTLPGAGRGGGGSRAPAAAAPRPPARRRVEGERADVLDDDEVGPARPVSSSPVSGGSVVSMASPGRHVGRAGRPPW